MALRQPALLRSLARIATLPPLKKDPAVDVHTDGADQEHVPGSADQGHATAAAPVDVLTDEETHQQRVNAMNTLLLLAQSCTDAKLKAKVQARERVAWMDVRSALLEQENDDPDSTFGLSATIHSANNKALMHALEYIVLLGPEDTYTSVLSQIMAIEDELQGKDMDRLSESERQLVAMLQTLANEIEANDMKACRQSMSTLADVVNTFVSERTDATKQLAVANDKVVRYKSAVATLKADLVAEQEKAEWWTESAEGAASKAELAEIELKTLQELIRTTKKVIHAQTERMQNLEADLTVSKNNNHNYDLTINDLNAALCLESKRTQTAEKHIEQQQKEHRKALAELAALQLATGKERSDAVDAMNFKDEMSQQIKTLNGLVEKYKSSFLSEQSKADSLEAAVTVRVYMQRTAHAGHTRA